MDANLKFHAAVGAGSPHLLAKCRQTLAIWVVLASHEFADVAVIAMERAMSVPARRHHQRVFKVPFPTAAHSPSRVDAGPGWPTLAEQADPVRATPSTGLKPATGSLALFSGRARRGEGEGKGHRRARQSRGGPIARDN